MNVHETAPLKPTRTAAAGYDQDTDAPEVQPHRHNLPSTAGGWRRRRRFQRRSPQNPVGRADTSNSGRAGRDVFRARSGHSKSRSSHQGAHIAPRPRSCSEWATHPVPGALGANLGSIVPPGSCGATEPLKAEPANLEPGCPLSSRAFCVNNRIRTTRDLRQTNADLVARSGVRVAAHGGLCRPQRFYAALTYCGGGCEGLTAMPTHGREAYVRS